MSEQTPEPAPADEAPELTDPVGLNGASLMGITAWPVDGGPQHGPDVYTSVPPIPPVPPTAAELRAQAEKLLAEADAIDAQHP